MVSNYSVFPGQDGNHTISGGLHPHPAQEVILWLVPILNGSLNLLVFIVVPRIKTLRVSTAAGMLSLAVTDFSVGIIGFTNMSYSWYTGFQLNINQLLCGVIGHALAFFTSVSIVMLTYLNIDRFLIFLYPLSYRLTRKRVVITNMAIWAGVLILQLPNMMKPNSYQYYEHAFVCLISWTDDIPYKLVGMVLLFLVPTIINLVSFCGSFYLIRSHHKRLSARGNSVNVYYGEQGSDSRDTQWSRDQRTFKVLAIMTFGFYIAWFPYINTMALPEVIVGHTLHPATDFFTPQLAASNSFWNPIIYMLTLRPFTRALCQLCKNTPCGRYRSSSTGLNTSAPGSRGTTDNSREDTNRTQEQTVEEKCTRF